MDSTHRRKFEDPSLLNSLAACIDFDALAPGLLTKRIMTVAMIEDIREKNAGEREICLLRRIPKRGPMAYDLFIGLLHENDMHQAVGLLTDTPEPVEPMHHSGIQGFGGGEACPVVNLVHSQPGASGTQADPGNTGHVTVGDVSVAELLVTPAEEWKTGPDVYNMMHSPRGLCMIINNRNFICGHEERKGSELDVWRMVSLLSALHFKCVVHEDLSAKDMKEVLSSAARSEEQKDADCLIVILMSHGTEMGILGSDGDTVHLRNDVYALFNNENCPMLQEKPKVFIVQACRGSMFETGTWAVVPDTPDMVPDTPDMVPGAGRHRALPLPVRKRVSNWSDMFFIYATIHSYRSYKNEVIGSWLLLAVYTVFSKHACDLHLDELMHRVHDQVLQRSSDDGCKQTPEVKGWGWRKKLYFNPGLCKKRNPVEGVTHHAAGM